GHKQAAGTTSESRRSLHWRDRLSPRETLLLHAELDRLDGIGRIHRVMLRLIGIDEGCEHIQAVAVAGSRLRAPKAFDLLERSLIIPLCPDRFHFSRHAAPSSHRSCHSLYASKIVGDHELERAGASQQVGQAGFGLAQFLPILPNSQAAVRSRAAAV